MSSLLIKSKIEVVSDLLDADMDHLLDIAGLEEDSLDDIYSAVQTFVERKIEPDVGEVEDIQEILSDASLDEDKTITKTNSVITD